MGVGSGVCRCEMRKEVEIIKGMGAINRQTKEKINKQTLVNTTRRKIKKQREKDGRKERNYQKPTRNTK